MSHVLRNQDIGNPADELLEVYRAGMKFDINNPGAMVSFQARHLGDATMAHVGLAAEYIQPISAVTEGYFTPPGAYPCGMGQEAGLGIWESWMLLATKCT